jgi:hypothetical protein
MIRVLVLTALLTTACTDSASLKSQHLSAFSRAVPVCELLAHPSKYLVQEIEVSGLYANGPHQRILYDPNCVPKELAIQITPTSKSLSADRKMQKLLDAANGRGVRSVYQGLLVSEQVVGTCSDESCRKHKLTNARLLAMEPTD